MYLALKSPQSGNLLLCMCLSARVLPRSKKFEALKSCGCELPLTLSIYLADVCCVPSGLALLRRWLPFTLEHGSCLHKVRMCLALVQCLLATPDMSDTVAAGACALILHVCACACVHAVI